MKIVISICCIYMLLLFYSCSNFLEVKPDIKMVIPKNLDDAELLLNDYSTMNTGYPIYGEWSADEYYVSSETFDGLLNFHQRNTYTWMDIVYDDIVQWQRPYKAIFNANQVLEIVKNVQGNSDEARSKNLNGIAYFYRAFAFQQLAEVFAPPYHISTAQFEMGIPLRLQPAIDAPSTRASLQETFDQIIMDYKSAIDRLPVEEEIKGRPSKASAYAGLARTYLYIGNYAKAYDYADSCLQLKADLMDFNILKGTSTLPIAKFNVEVIFAAVSATAGPMSLNNGLVDTILYRSYTDHDLRKSIFFRKNTIPLNSYGYKGSYDNAQANLFVGLTTSEMYLIKAEAATRSRKIDEALQALNKLSEKRFVKNQYIPVTERNATLLLPLILQERQKELVFRGRRWSDLKRLNLDPQFQKTIKREINGVRYQLEPNSRKYAYRLPEIVINNGNLPQNIR